MALTVGDPAPDFTLPREGGGDLSLASLRGRTVVLYFYPKDDTSGCTIEAKDFSCLTKEFAEAGAVVIGMSPDNAKSHAKFRIKHGLSVELASDESKETLQAYGVWAEKSMYGRKYMGVVRTTFLIDRDGKIAQIWEKVSVPDHATEVLVAARALSKSD